MARGGNRFSVFFLILLFVAVPLYSQSPDDNQSQKHSGSDEGKNGPKSQTSPPPARSATNPENPDSANGKVQTMTGIVSDSFCGPKHYQLSGATPAECTRYCIAHRGTFALVVRDKVYALQNRPGHTLDALAGQQATVTGAVSGNVIEIQSVSSAGVQGRGRGQ